MRREVFGVTRSLVRGQSTITAAGEDDHGGAGRGFRGGKERSDRGLVLVCIAECARRLARPKQHGIQWRGVSGGNEGEQGEGEQAHDVTSFSLIVLRFVKDRLHPERFSKGWINAAVEL